MAGSEGLLTEVNWKVLEQRARAKRSGLVGCPAPWVVQRFFYVWEADCVPDETVPKNPHSPQNISSVPRTPLGKLTGGVDFP